MSILRVGNTAIAQFKDGTYGIRIVKDYVRIFHMDNVLRYRKLTEPEKDKLLS